MNAKLSANPNLKGIGGWLLLLIFFSGPVYSGNGSMEPLQGIHSGSAEDADSGIQPPVGAIPADGLDCFRCFVCALFRGWLCLVASQKTDDGSAGYRCVMAVRAVRSRHLCRNRFGHFQYGLFAGVKTFLDRHFFDVCPECDLDRLSRQIRQGQKYVLSLKR